MPIFSLPPELLAKIAFEAASSDRKRLRSACRYFCAIATPAVFETIVIDFKRMSFTPQRAINHLKQITEGAQLARHARTVVFKSTSTRRKALNRLWNSLTNIQESQMRAESVEELLLAAIALMQSLRHVIWDNFEPGTLDPEAIQEIILRLSNLPLLSTVSIDQHRPKYDVPFGLFHNLHGLTVRDGATIHDIPSVIANSPHLVNLSIDHDLYLDSNFNLSILHVILLFSKFPRGQFSNVQVLDLSAIRADLPPSSVSSLVPHLRSLTDLSIRDFVLPAEFWDSLCDANIHLKCLSLDPCEVGPALTHYLSSFTTLRWLYISLRKPPAHSEHDAMHPSWFLKAVRIHALHLTGLHILPSAPGSWCLNELIIGYLLLCVNLRSISIRVDNDSARVEGSKNVVQQLIRCLHIWNSLIRLEIRAVDDRSDHPSYYRGVPGCVLRNILAAYCLRPTAAMLEMTLETNLAELRMRQHPLESDKYAFRPQCLTYAGRKAAKEQKKGPILDGDDEVEPIMFKLVK
ncbi:hypothetical protein F5146DRAFT_1075487 [Armillaria mellea]|nr:hypothetical protein F5146DRAFT_1075487 [Armillaria mellea]